MSAMPARVESMLEPLSKSASVKAIYGDPISANGKTIIPVARVAYGFGGGTGRQQGQDSPREGEGGGGGVYAVPVGVVEVTDTETRFVALNQKRHLVVAAILGFGLGAFWASRRH